MSALCQHRRCCVPRGSLVSIQSLAARQQPQRAHTMRAHTVRCTAGSPAAMRRAVLLGGATLAASHLQRPPVRAEPAGSASEMMQRTLKLESALESRVSRLLLPNGLRLLVIRRPDAPVVSINTYVTAGAWVEENGQTGECSQSGRGDGEMVFAGLEGPSGGPHAGREPWLLPTPVAFHTRKPGVAHLLEHLAFKGTPRIGSRNWREESSLLRAVDEG